MIGRRLVMLVAGLLLAAGWMGGAAALETFARSSLTIETAAGGKFRFDIELAETPNQQAQGLMFRQTMAPDAGMLFPYAVAQPVAFWMKNTLISLDMLFIGADGRIVNIHERAVPGSLDGIRSAGPVKAVLELNGGTAAKLGLRPGDRVVHTVFGNVK